MGGRLRGAKDRGGDGGGREPGRKYGLRRREGGKGWRTKEEKTGGDEYDNFHTREEKHF